MLVLAAAFAQGALGFSSPAESANITNFSVTIRESVVTGQRFILRPQNVTCGTAVHNFTLPAWLPPTSCSDPSYTFSLGREEGRGWVVSVNHTLAQG